MNQMHKYPTSFQAVDCIILDRSERNILLGKKKDQDKWRFIGGFVDPSDISLEAAADRELGEEVIGIVSNKQPSYVGSFRVDDQRYKDSVDKIMSAVFSIHLSKYSDSLRGGDDIEFVKWFSLEEVEDNYEKIIMPEHFPIVENFLSQFFD